MFGSSILKNLFTRVIATGFVTGVFHSVKMVPLKEGGFKPAAPVDGKIQYVGIDDTQGFSCYCRQIGKAEVESKKRVSSTQNRYRMNIPHRLVFFNASENRSHEDITSKLMKAVIGSEKIRLTSVNPLVENIVQSEAPTGKFNFKTDTFLIAIDFFVLLDVQTDNCITEISCEGIPNPYCTG